MQHISKQTNKQTAITHICIISFSNHLHTSGIASPHLSSRHPWWFWTWSRAPPPHRQQTSGFALKSYSSSSTTKSQKSFNQLNLQTQTLWYTDVQPSLWFNTVNCVVRFLKHPTRRFLSGSVRHVCGLRWWWGTQKAFKFLSVWFYCGKQQYLQPDTNTHTSSLTYDTAWSCFSACDLIAPLREDIFNLCNHSFILKDGVIQPEHDNTLDAMTDSCARVYTEKGGRPPFICMKGTWCCIKPQNAQLTAPEGASVQKCFPLTVLSKCAFSVSHVTMSVSDFIILGQMFLKKGLLRCLYLKKIQLYDRHLLDLFQMSSMSGALHGFWSSFIHGVHQAHLVLV